MDHAGKGFKKQLGTIELEYSEKLDLVINQNEDNFANLDKKNIYLTTQLNKSEEQVSYLSEKLAKTLEKLAAICPSFELK